MERVERRLKGVSAWRVGAVALLAACVCLVGTARADAALTIESPASGSSTTNKSPTFSGSGASAGEVKVEIFKVGLSTAVSKATGTSTGGSWSSGSASPALEDGSYEALASEGFEVSEPVTFTVETIAPPAPAVELNNPGSSSTATPTFTGKASGTKPVVIGIYTAASEEVAQATATSSGGSWTSGSSSPALKNGTYFAVAEEASEGGLSGTSSVVEFTIAVAAPTVTITKPTSPSNNTTPSFTGTASATTKVTVNVYAGATATGTVVATATATPSATSWTSGKVSALKEGEYTAVASQPSSITGDPEGKSSAVTFKVVLEAPTVTLSPPSEVSGDTTPTFSGTAGETTTVTVDIYSGTSATGSIVSKATATPSLGSWTSGPSSPALKTSGKYTAVATQPSSLTGNPEGKSAPATFELDTRAPELAMSAPSKRSNNAEPTFSGTTNDNGKAVSVNIYAGPTAKGTVVSSATATPQGGKWTTGKAKPALGSAEYTAQAQQESSIVGDEHVIGLSAADSFIIDTTPPEAVQPAGQTLQPLAPTASFAWFPTSPHINEPVALVSGSTDPSSAITAFAWDLAGNGKFASGSAVISTSFATAGNHIVQLLVTDANNLSSIATETIPVTLAGPVLMQPFPIVQIISSDTEYGVRLGLLRVQAPVGARITVVCRGRGCPVKAEHAIAAGSKGAVSGRVQFRRYERSLRAGVTLEIRVFKGGEIGKFTRFVVRRGRLPLRTDTCLNPAGTKTMTCPS